jgi:thiamine pyrophosphokinase
LRIIIFANGQYEYNYIPQVDDVVLAADGGGLHCLTSDVQPSAVIGDMDSLSEEALEALKAAGAKILTYPRQKDHTDLELALDYASGMNPSEIIILAGLGGRWDQSIANILLAATYSQAPIRILHGAQEFLFLHAGDQLTIQGKPGDIISLIPLGGDARGIRTHGLVHPLEDEPLSFGSTRGISNVLLSESASITLAEGLLLCSIEHS